MIQPERIKTLNDRPIQTGQFVLYWMQAAQRTEYNHALEYALRQANEQKLPLVTLFVVTDRFPEANLRHYVFMIEGLKDVKAGLKERGIPFIVLDGPPEKEAVKMSRLATMVVTDRGYLRIQKEWRRYRTQNALCP